jgi:DNA-binding response OmpR family regulator
MPKCRSCQMERMQSSCLSVWNRESLPCPALIILDLNLPKKSVHEVLHRIRQTRRCANAAVLVVTSSDSERDRDEMAKLGIKDYFRKPSEYENFMKLGELVKSLLRQTPESGLLNKQGRAENSRRELSDLPQ